MEYADIPVWKKMFDSLVSVAGFLVTIICGALTAGATALVWVVRLEGRVNLHERLLTQIANDVQYIRTRVDRFSDTPS